VSRSVDIGTCFLVSGLQDSNRQIQYKSVRDAFLDMDNDGQVKTMLKNSQIDFIESEDKLYIIGDSALTMANIFKREARRPLSKGVLSPGELEAEKILMVLLENILGRAVVANETCFYSVPGAPVDRDMDIVYHTAMFSKMVGNLGYKPMALNEAAAISYSNAAKEQFSSLSLSFGAGMVNICLMFKTLIGMAFSISRSGDFVDESAAKATGTTASRIMAIKEKGVNLLDPSEGDPKTFREREAISIYYKSLVLYALDNIKNEFLKRQGTIELPHSIPLIISGGTAKAKNFKEFFESAFNTVKDKFPIPISEVRMATDPLNAVAQGLLVAALNYDEGQK
jgi:hypothetical protein